MGNKYRARLPMISGKLGRSLPQLGGNMKRTKFARCESIGGKISMATCLSHCLAGILNSSDIDTTQLGDRLTLVVHG